MKTPLLLPLAAALVVASLSGCQTTAEKPEPRPVAVKKAPRSTQAAGVQAGSTSVPAADSHAATAPSSARATAAASASVADAKAWVGRWRGPEGTWLEVVEKDGLYSVTLHDLDGARDFPAESVANGLAFTRNGVRETLRATHGKGTGMKGLAGKTRCLATRVGEGWCRD